MKIKSSGLINFVFITLFLVAGPVYGADIFVAPTSATPEDGSSNNPYTNIQTALNVAQADDTIRVRPGTYSVPSGLNFPRGGTVQNRITLLGDGPSRSVVIDCQWGTVNCITIDRSNITVENLEVKNARYNGIKIDGDVNGTNDGNEYGNWNNNRTGDPGLRRYRVNGADNIILRNNYVHHICFDGLKIGHTNNTLIVDNEIYKTGMTDPVSGASNQQQGIDLVGVYNTTIRNNYVHDDQTGSSMDVGLFAKGGSENILIENNLVANIASPFAGIEIGGDTESYNTRYTPSQVSSQFHADMLNGRAADGTFNYPIESSSYYVPSTMAEARMVIVRGNVVINADPPLSPRNAFNVNIYNNTVINSGWTQSWVKIWTDGNILHEAQDVKIFNNIFYNSTVAIGQGGVRYNNRNVGYNKTGFSSDYNFFFNRGNTTSSGDFATTNPDQHSRTGDPMIDDNGVPLENSPIRNVGANLYQTGILATGQTWTDRAGNSRPTATETSSGFDIGAYSYQYQTPVTKQGDLNSDNVVDIFDYNILLGNFGRTGSGIMGDIDVNGKVDIFDYNLLVGNFGK